MRRRFLRSLFVLLLSVPPHELLETQVVYTIFDGKIIYERSKSR